MLNKTIRDIAQQIIDRPEFALSLEEALQLAHGGPEVAMDLIFCADKIRRHFKQKRIFTCAIVNAKSGACPEDCAFCAQSAHHQTGAPRYDLLGAQELIATGMKMAAAGATHYSVVTSGTALNNKEIETVCQTARALKARTGLTLCASLGMLDPAAARVLKAAGITRYHHNLETARSHFDSICTTHAYDDDIATVRAARDAGLFICSGGIFGLGESWAQRVELAFTLRELNVDAIPINFLNPIAGTPLSDRPLLSPLEALQCIALYRFIHPRKDIPICGGREVTLRDFQSWIFTAGANGVMLGNYLTTQGRHIGIDLEMIAALEMTHAA